MTPPILSAAPPHGVIKIPGNVTVGLPTQSPKSIYGGRVIAVIQNPYQYRDEPRYLGLAICSAFAVGCIVAGGMTLGACKNNLYGSCSGFFETAGLVITCVGCGIVGAEVLLITSLCCWFGLDVIAAD